jgi:hypothetical protein
MQYPAQNLILPLLPYADPGLVNAVEPLQVGWESI